MVKHQIFNWCEHIIPMSVEANGEQYLLAIEQVWYVRIKRHLSVAGTLEEHETAGSEGGGHELSHRQLVFRLPQPPHPHVLQVCCIAYTWHLHVVQVLHAGGVVTDDWFGHTPLQLHVHLDHAPVPPRGELRMAVNLHVVVFTTVELLPEHSAVWWPLSIGSIDSDVAHIAAQAYRKVSGPAGLLVFIPELLPNTGKESLRNIRHVEHVLHGVRTFRIPVRADAYKDGACKFRRPFEPRQQCRASWALASTNLPRPGLLPCIGALPLPRQRLWLL
mmetsp:Transcript_13994/g.42248  ORF Transcript_13994/g.42248 Transcript_13994/m.42248 type:complete len:275 (+) Transcript_13994:1963-2787(+)